ncbi:MAG: RNA-guided pseudouridylation complex pseudouridine synthase subunit Cbf5 [Nanoarchaeota archaeon]
MKPNIRKIKQEKTIKELLEFSIINIDKSSGPTSFSVSEFIKKTLNLRKTSHFGTLDPKVTGVLPIALNRGCKLTGFFLRENKTYIGILRLHKDIDIKKIQRKIKEKFTGEILQTPPLKSRVKRQERKRTIYEFKLLEKNNLDILFLVSCQGGTYIRKLISDLGKEMNIGMHMLELRRTKAGIFSEPSINLYDFENAVKKYKNGNEFLLKEILIPGEIISELYPNIEINPDSIKKLYTGKPILQKDMTKTSLIKLKNLKKENLICCFSKNKFVGTYKIINPFPKRETEVCAKADFVLQPLKNSQNTIQKP